MNQANGSVDEEAQRRKARLILLFIVADFIFFGLLGIYLISNSDTSLDEGENKEIPPVESSNVEEKKEGSTVKNEDPKSVHWDKKLTPEQIRVCRDGGTESPFSGKYYDFHEKGVYTCSVCGLELFSSDTKFDSGTGWPSFYAPVAPENVATKEDRSHGMVRTEVLCPRCGAHLGHVFDDGPQPTGKRYCINSVSLEHKPTK